MEIGLHRDTWIEVDLKAIEQNIKNAISILPNNTTLFAVLKGGAYGHGTLEVAKAALRAGAKGFCVALLDEALFIRKNGINQVPILVLGPIRPHDVNLAGKYNISFPIIDQAHFQELKNYWDGYTPLKIHFAVDTGMGRIGFREIHEMKKIEKAILSLNQWIIEGIFTHFASADQFDTTYFEMQLSQFKRMVASLEKEPTFVHCSNSASALLHPTLPFTAVRFGVAMYGLNPSYEIKDILPFRLYPALSLYTRLTQVKLAYKGDKISYSSTYTVTEKEWIGTLPIGYADGWTSKMQGFQVIVDGCLAPIIGKIGMDQCMIRLPYELPVGSKVTLIGKDYPHSITSDEVGDKQNMNNCEVILLLTNRVPRYYKNG
ncbi:alanine racemase [Niallia sp. 03133]|uniref:alanine racemase n=1 Tax=Niallia sp. 03133 TaxID=3458060 RepID=UPI004043C58A